MSELKESRLRFVDKKGDFYFRMSLENKGEEPKQVLKIKIAN